MILHANSISSLEQILRNAANTKYPELKKWRFKLKHDHILAIPKDIYVTQELSKINEYMDYLSLVQYLLDNLGQEIEFSNAFLTEGEYKKLEKFLNERNQKYEKIDSKLRIING